CRKTILFPWSDQTGSEYRPATFVKRCGLPPFALKLILYKCPPLPSQVVHTSCDPSGLHAGIASVNSKLLTRLGVPFVRFMVYRRFKAVKAICFPSGDTTGFLIWVATISLSS